MKDGDNANRLTPSEIEDLRLDKKETVQRLRELSAEKPVSIGFFPQAAVEAGEVQASALISITGTAASPAAVDPVLFDGRLLRLVFDDIAVPAWAIERPFVEQFFGPTCDQVAEAMAFARQVTGPLAVHCLKGQSRSAAVCLAILADRCGDAKEAVRRLLETAAALPSAFWPVQVTSTDVALAVLNGLPTPRPRPRVQPNPLIVRHAENLLGIIGQLDGELTAACPDYVTWRSYWTVRGWR